MANEQPDILHQGRFLELVSINGWEVARRSNVSGVVAILPRHNNGRVVLVEQFRPAAGGEVIEWPAGLVGDDGMAEPHLDAAKRELLEETGYEAQEWERLGEGFSSAGLTDEAVVFYLAKDLRRAADGGGVDGEDIGSHEIALCDLPGWLQDMKCAGKRIDLKVYAGLGMLNKPAKEEST